MSSWAITYLYVLFAALATLGNIFKKREVAASKVVLVEKARTKRPRKEGGSPIVKKVPAFIAVRPTAIDEDPNPYVVQWGLLNKDTVVGDTRAAVEWSKNVVTPRDKAHVVESSDDLQIELLGAQAVASVKIPLPFYLPFNTSSLVIFLKAYFSCFHHLVGQYLPSGCPPQLEGGEDRENDR